MQKFIMVMLMLAMLCPMAAVAGTATEYEAASDGTAEVTFPPNPYGGQKVASGEIRSDYTGTVRFYARGGQGRVTPTAMVTTNITVGSSDGFGVGNHVVYYDTSADAAYYRTVSATNATNIAVNSAVGVTWAAGDQLYEITQQGQLDILASSAITYSDTMATASVSEVVWIPSATTTTQAVEDIVWIYTTNSVISQVTNTINRAFTAYTLVQVTNTVESPYVTSAGAAAGVTGSGIAVTLADGVFVTVTDSPLYIIVTATGGTSSNVTLNATAEDL